MLKRIKKESNTVKQTRDNLVLELIPNVSYDIFILGDNIKHYLHFKSSTRDSSEANNTYDTYYFEDKEVTVWVKESVIDTIHCEKHCYWRGRNLIGMNYNIFLENYGLESESSETIYVYKGSVNRGQNQTVYDFEEEGLLVWVWRNKIRTVLVSTYKE